MVNFVWNVLKKTKEDYQNFINGRKEDMAITVNLLELLNKVNQQICTCSHRYDEHVSKGCKICNCKKFKGERQCRGEEE